MTRTEVRPGRSARRILVAAAVLEVTAGALGIAGLALCAVAAASLTRQRVARMDVAPSELARRHWARARTAASAGVGAWRGVQGAPAADGIRRGRESSLL